MEFFIAGITGFFAGVGVTVSVFTIMNIDFSQGVPSKPTSPPRLPVGGYQPVINPSDLMTLTPTPPGDE